MMENTANALRLPCKPQAVFHKWGGQILEITEIRHELCRPCGGHSRDTWAYHGTTRWTDGTVSTGAIQPVHLCADTEDGHAEIAALEKLLMDYLAKHGEWRDATPRGWYARRPQHS